jgi:hypothetical protein
MDPEEIREVIKRLEVGDKILIESSDTHKFEIDTISEEHLRLLGPQKGRYWLYPSPERNINSGNNPVQIQDDSHGSSHRRVWYIEKLSSDP